MNTDIEIALKFAALTHLGLIAAGVMMPRATGLWRECAKLAPFPRTLFGVYYAFIGLCLVSFGLGSWLFAAELSSGTPFARAVCAFLAAFWTIRLVAALLLDVTPYLTNVWWRVGYHATNVVFSTLPFIYAWAAFAP
ncbi:MAG: hypothetical protein JNL39_12825 [Opitutaceae bacterium]|nr:hypothetical protein [Opitutaceae bacterium]